MAAVDILNVGEANNKPWEHNESTIGIQCEYNGNTIGIQPECIGNIIYIPLEYNGNVMGI